MMALIISEVCNYFRILLRDAWLFLVTEKAKKERLCLCALKTTHPFKEKVDYVASVCHLHSKINIYLDKLLLLP